MKQVSQDHYFYKVLKFSTIAVHVSTHVVLKHTCNINLQFCLNRDLDKVYNGMGQKIGMFLQNASIVLVGFIMGFVYGWKLTLVIIAISPLLMIAGGLMAKVTVYCV